MLRLIIVATFDTIIVHREMFLTNIILALELEWKLMFIQSND